MSGDRLIEAINGLSRGDFSKIIKKWKIKLINCRFLTFSIRV